MSHPTALAASLQRRTVTAQAAPTLDIKAQLHALKYRENGFHGAASTAAPIVAGLAPSKAASPISPVEVAGRQLTQDEIAQTVAKTLASRMQSSAQAHDHLLDERNSLSTVVQFKYTFRKALSEDALKKAKAVAGYVADDIRDTPLVVSHDAAFWTKAFGGKVDFSESRFALAGYVESVHSTSPAEYNWTLSGIQDKVIERVHSGNAEGATLTILPGMHSLQEKQLFVLKDVNTKHLFKHGNMDMAAELDALMPLKDTPLMLVDPKRKLGKILKRNEASITPANADGSAGTLTVVPVINMYAVHEDVLADVLEALNSQVLDSLKPTDFTNITGTLTRADRSATAASAKEFADFSDVAGLTRAGLQAAEQTQHSVVLNVRFHAIDPAKLDVHAQ